MTRSVESGFGRRWSLRTRGVGRWAGFNGVDGDTIADAAGDYEASDCDGSIWKKIKAKYSHQSFH